MARVAGDLEQLLWARGPPFHAPRSEGHGLSQLEGGPKGFWMDLGFGQAEVLLQPCHL